LNFGLSLGSDSFGIIDNGCAGQRPLVHDDSADLDTVGEEEEEIDGGETRQTMSGTVVPGWKGREHYR